MASVESVHNEHIGQTIPGLSQNIRRNAARAKKALNEDYIIKYQRINLIKTEKKKKQSL
jgi:hypothetical protein